MKKIKTLMFSCLFLILGISLLYPMDSYWRSVGPGRTLGARSQGGTLVVRPDRNPAMPSREELIDSLFKKLLSDRIKALFRLYRIKVAQRRDLHRNVILPVLEQQGLTACWNELKGNFIGSGFLTIEEIEQILRGEGSLLEEIASCAEKALLKSFVDRSEGTERIIKEDSVDGSRSLLSNLLTVVNGSVDNLNVGRVEPFAYDRNAFIEKITEKTVVVQLPTLQQEGLRCGYYAWFNAEKLAVFEDLNLLLDVLSRKETRKAVQEDVQRIGLERFLDGQQDEYAGENLWVDELVRLNGGSLSQIVLGSDSVYRSIVQFGQDGERLFDEIKNAIGEDGLNPLERFSATKNPEVLVVQIRGHWIALRLEAMPNGMLGILFLDSATGGREKISTNSDLFISFVSIFEELV